MKKKNDILKFIAECSILYDVDIEESKVFDKFLITKKKHYIGIHQDETKEPEIKGMEGIKSDRPLWINKIEKQFAKDLQYGYDPTINIRRQYITMESGQVPLDELIIKITLRKDPSKYSQNSLQRVISNEIGAQQGDTISYFKSDISGGGTSKSNLINPRKYLEILKTTVEDSLKVMGYDYVRDIVGQKKLCDYTTLPKSKVIVTSNVLPSSVPSEELNTQNLPWVSKNPSKSAFSLDIGTIIRCQTTKKDHYTYIPCSPAKGVLYITGDNPTYISGQIRMRGKDEGRYPYKYLEMIDTIFGPVDNTIEVCSRSVTGVNKGGSCFTVDINPDCNPDLAVDETIKNDKKYLKKEAFRILTRSGTEELAYQYYTMIQNILNCNRECWKLFDDKDSSPKIKLQALKTTIECSRELNQLVKDSTSVTTLENLKKKIEEITAMQDNTAERSYMTVRMPSLVESEDCIEYR